MTIDAMDPLQIMQVELPRWQDGPFLRATTDKLDALGNTTAAMGKGFAIGSALLTALAMFSAYVQKAALPGLDLTAPVVTVGLFIAV